MKTIGGYIMIDCKGLNLLSQTTQKVTGLYKDVTRAMALGKPIQAYNCTYGEGVPMTPIELFAINEAGLLICTASILQIRIASNDDVTIANLITDFND